MKHILLLIAALTMSAGCARLPAIVPEDHPDAYPARDIVSWIYASGSWQFSHTIRATVPGGKTIEMVGVTVLSSKDRSIRCVLMTLEGIVLFSGRFDGELIVERAITPFDQPGFPEGLMNDLSLLYFVPKSSVISNGRLSDGSARVVRFFSAERVTIDLHFREDQTWAIYEYFPGSKLLRSVEARDVSRIEGGGNNMAAKIIVLRRPGLLGYRLDMRLIEAIDLSE